MIGQTISHYKILEVIGEGGMGVVYRALDIRLNRTVALKFLPPDRTRNSEARERFIREAKSASALQHHNICTIHDIGETSDHQMFIVMDCYEGQTLKKRIDSGPLEIGETLDIVDQVARGLQKAHEKGIIHRDIKPANILITTDGVAKIVDFGLATLTGGAMLTQLGTTVGTAAYMSPEQARGKHVDQRSDLWSVGVMMYEMITGELPFKSEHQEAILYSILNESPAPISELLSGVPMELERIVKKAMQKDPNLRYQNVLDLAADLAAVRGELRLGILKADRQKLRVWMTKRGYIYSGVSVIALLLIASIVYFWQNSQWKLQTSALEAGKGETEAAFNWSNSIAVLPFKNASSDSTQEYFCDGMTEQIITNLSRLRRLGVTNFRSASRYKRSEKTISEIGNELKTAYVLEGSVYKSGNKIRVTAQLTRTEGSRYLWANKYVCDLDDVFAVQDSVSQEIATELLQTLSPSEASQTRTDRPKNAEAYDCFMKAIYFATRFSRTANIDSYTNAENLFKETIKLDSTYALAYARLAALYSAYDFNYRLSAEKWKRSFDIQRGLNERALRLDPNSADIMSLIANALLVRGLEAEKSYELLRQALQINPNHVDANINMGLWLRIQGLVYHSFKYLDKVQKLDPLHPWGYTARGHSFWEIGDSENALSEFRKALQIEPNDIFTSRWYIVILIFAEQLVEAEKSLKDFERTWPGRSDGRALKTYLLAAQGQEHNAPKTYPEFAGEFGKVMLCLLLKMKDEAIRLLDGEQKRTLSDSTQSSYLLLKYCPMYEILRDDSRFQEILAREKRKYDVLVKRYGI